jgi:hypothetical protein
MPRTSIRVVGGAVRHRGADPINRPNGSNGVIAQLHPVPRDRQTAVRRPIPACKPLAAEFDQPHAIAVSVNDQVKPSCFISWGARTRSRHSGLGQVAVQNANFGVVAGVSALGTEAVRQEGAGLSIALCRSRRVLGALVVDVPPLF